MFDRQLLQHGMPVRSYDGEKLGRIVAMGEGAFEVEKGLFFKEDYRVTYDEIADIQNDEVILRRNLDELKSAPPLTDEKMAAQTSSASATWEGEGGEVRIPLAEEQLEIHKREKSAGEVVIHKEVVAEQRTVQVPVMREEARVERMPASSQEAAEAPLQLGKEETLRVPLKEEEVEVTKKPVIREELRVRKERTSEEAPVSETLLRERAEVRAAGEEGTPVPRGAPGESPYKRS